MSKDREISLAWNRYNVAFRLGFAAFHRGEMNPGQRLGNGERPRGLYYGYVWASEGKALPDDPMYTALNKDGLLDKLG